MNLCLDRRNQHVCTQTHQLLSPFLLTFVCQGHLRHLPLDGCPSHLDSPHLTFRLPIALHLVPAVITGTPHSSAVVNYGCTCIRLSLSQGTWSVSFPTVCFPFVLLSTDSLSPDGLFMPIAIWTPPQLYVPLTPLVLLTTYLPPPMLQHWLWHACLSISSS